MQKIWWFLSFSCCFDDEFEILMRTFCENKGPEKSLTMVGSKWVARMFFMALLCNQGEAKIEQGVIQLTSENSEHYLTKFSFSPGSKGWMTTSFKV
jgi:hypothetical protein